ncbi:hypothetical protein BH23GEM9_BH23GEM9_07670 [soil metagenome]
MPWDEPADAPASIPIIPTIPTSPLKEPIFDRERR